MQPRLDRRTFIRLAGVSSAAALLPLAIEACAPAAPSTANAPTAASTASASSLLPTYMLGANRPKPDFPAGDELYCDAFNRYPSNPAKALPTEAPGTGSTVTIFTEAALPLPTPIDQNPAWQAVNKQLNANVQYTIVSVADYPAKLATIMAGNDLPDILSFVTITAGSNALSFVPGGQQFLQAQAADLTPFLAGDAAKDYPNLAAIPTHSWKNAGCAYQGKLYMVPFQRTLAGNVWLKNASVYDREIGQDYVPKDADDFKRILQALTRPQENFYGMGGNPGGAQSPALWLNFFSAAFGAPNNWRLDSSGKLTSTFETAEYREAVGYVRDLWAAGLFHPDSITTVTRTDFQGGKFAIFIDTFNGWQDSLRQAPKFNPAPDFKLFPLFPAHASQKLQFFTIGGYGGTIAFKKAGAERIKELLRIANWLAAPFGSQEDLLLTYGVPGDDYALDDSGVPKPTAKSNQDANYVPWKYTAQHPFVFFAPDVPNYGGTASAAEHTVLPYAVPDPTFGSVSATATSKGVALTNTINDGLTGLVVGRRPMSDYDQIVQDWLTNGGEQMRKEFMDALASAR